MVSRGRTGYSVGAVFAGYDTNAVRNYLLPPDRGQQSAEKYLKGFLALNGEPIHKTHDLTMLNKLCFKYDALFSEIGDDCLYLTDFGVNVRYPFGIEINEHDMKIALNKAIRLQKFVLEKLNNF